MSENRATRIWVILLVLFAGQTLPTFSKTGIEGAKVVTGPPGSFRETLHRLLQQEEGPAWLGYAVPIVEGRHRMCCFNSDSPRGASACCTGCRLEDNDSFTFSHDGDDSVKLEPADNLVVVFRIRDGEIQKLRTFSSDCHLEAGGVPFYWLRDVTPVESLEWLQSLLKGDLRDEGIAAIALHEDQEADRILEKLVSSREPTSVRGQAAFWMGVARGQPGFDTLRRLARQEGRPQMREKIVMALAQSRVPEATDQLIDMARKDESADVRSQALFWLAQKAGRRAAAAITTAIEEDPETEVKKQAVFALSQLPREESILMLIDLAQSHGNPAVRKAALFWLGQSDDPRVLDFIEKILAS